MSEKKIKTSVKAFALSLFTALTIVSWLSLSSANAQQPPQLKNPYTLEWQKKIAGQEGKPAEEVFKNIQTLKGIPAGRLLAIMEIAFTAGLGVDCTHCHSTEKWESDDKETKPITRKMWVWQAKLRQEAQEITGRKQAGVNCTTCHRGQTKPALNLPPKAN